MSSAWAESWGNAWGDSWGARLVSGGKGDNGPDIFKPTGLVERKRKKLTVNDARVEETREIDFEVKKQVAREFSQSSSFAPIERMTMAEIDAEIKTLLHKKLRTEDEEALLLILLAAS